MRVPKSACGGDICALLGGSSGEVVDGRWELGLEDWR